LAFALVAVAISNLISTISKDRRQANTINVMITTPLCMLGGCFWPIDITPKVMQYISNFTPTKWVIDAVAKTTAGGGLNTVTNELVILMLFAFAIFAISTSKRIAWSK
jgi:ABC-2 type transport system permease protein